MSLKDAIANFFGFGSESPSNHYTPQGFDRIASVYVTPGPDGKKRRHDGSTFDQPYQHAAGYDPRRKDFLSKFFGSQVFETPSGWRGIAGAEMIKGPDGLFHRKDDMRPQQGRRGGLPNNDDSLGRED